MDTFIWRLLLTLLVLLDMQCNFVNSGVYAKIRHEHHKMERKVETKYKGPNPKSIGRDLSR